MAPRRCFLRDDRLRRSVKRLALWHFVVNIRARRLFGRGTRYRLGGECRRCAKCCEAPSIKAGRLVWRLASLQRLFLWWQETVNGFQLVERLPDRTFVFRCTHFDLESRVCDSYDTRPGLCRDYPRVLLDQASPVFLPGCGYRPIAPNAAGLRRELESRSLPPEVLVELKRRLHLE